MTLFGHDVSSYNPHYQPVKGEFVVVKASEGAHTHDPEWATLSARVRAAGAYLMAYHFLHSDPDPAAQAANTASVAGIRGVPLMVDVEVEGSSRPTVAQCAQYVDAARRSGLNPRLVYLPHWYWQELGSPSLRPLADRGLHLVSSAYPDQGHYPGDNGTGWQAYGGMTPLIWQYSSVPLDCDAYRGTLDQLRTALGDVEPDMPLTPADAELVAQHVIAKTIPNQFRTDAHGNPVETPVSAFLVYGDAHFDVLNRQLTALTAQVGALSAAVAALAKNGGLTAEQVQAAAQAGAQAALQELGHSLDGSGVQASR